jgi:DNA-binding NarL/FixJ family response regulator
MGFDNITVTGVEKDGLNMLIHEMKPRIVFIGCRFYQCGTPFMMAALHKNFPKLNIAVVSIVDFPDDLAMYFIVNGAKSYVIFWEGEEEFLKGMREIREGREYVSPEVQKRIDMRSVYPNPSGRLTERQMEIVRLVANGFTGAEIADTLHISEGTVDNSKSEIYRAMNVRNENEVIRAAINLEILRPEELQFFPRDYVLKPRPTKQRIKTRGARVYDFAN